MTIALTPDEWAHAERSAVWGGVELGDIVSILLGNHIAHQMKIENIRTEFAAPMDTGRPDGWPLEEGSERFGQLPAESHA